MPEIYTTEWSQAFIELANSQDDLSAKVPAGEWRLAVEINGDGISPYIPDGETKHFFVYLLDGKIVEYKEFKEKIPGKGLNYRISGPAVVFDEIAAGIHDPIEKGLDGSLSIRGDMRMLLQNADLANVIFEVYTQAELTEWPKGKPPYE